MIVELPCGRFNLHIPSDRDDLVRRLWRKLRPDEPEPLTAPAFTGGGLVQYLTPPNREPIRFDARFHSPPDVYRVPRLADLPRLIDSDDLTREERDLLALAECGRVILGVRL